LISSATTAAAISNSFHHECLDASLAGAHSNSPLSLRQPCSFALPPVYGQNASPLNRFRAEPLRVLATDRTASRRSPSSFAT
jgi:hypothetical protein